MTIATDAAIELQDSSNTVFTSAEVTRGVNDALRHFSRYKPWEVTAILHTTLDSRLVDISTITESTLIYGYDESSFNSLYGVEYPVDTWNSEEDTLSYRNYEVIPDSIAPCILMKIRSAPDSGAEAVKVRYYKIWTEAALPAAFDDIIAKLAAAKVLSYKHLDGLNKFVALENKFGIILDALNEASSRLDQSIEDLGEGRDLVGDERDEAVTAIDATQAAITAIGTAITAAEAYYNTVNIGTPERDYITGSAQHQASIANEQLALARGHLAFESTSQSWRAHATTELQAANLSLSQLRGSAEHLKLWMSSINLAKEYEARSQVIMAEMNYELRKYSISCDTREWPRD